MQAIAFDTYAYAKRLKEAGFTEAQIEAQIEGMKLFAQDNLATKQDVGELKEDISDVRRELSETKSELKQDISDVRHKIESLESKLTIRLGAMLAAAVGIVAILVKLF